MIDCDCMVDGVPVSLGYDGVGEGRVIFTKDLDTLHVDQ